MGEIHNLQVVLTHQPNISKLEGPNRYGAANGAQVLRVVDEKKRAEEASKVRKLKPSEKTEKENSKKKRKSTLEHKIDLYS